MALIRVVAIWFIAFRGAMPAWAGDEPRPAPSAFRVAGYLPEYRAADFNPLAARGLTDLIVFSAQPTAAGDLDLSRLKRTPWTELRTFKTRERVRLILCVGGWGRSAHFAAVAGSPEARKQFAQAATRVCLDERLDGIDLDWEHPRNAAEEAGYGSLLAELRQAFAPHGLVLSVTVAGWQKLPREAISAVNWVQVMAYDHAGRHSTFDAARGDVKAMLDAGVPAEKLVLGLPFYGRHLTDRRRVLTYREIVARHRPGPDVDELDGVHYNGPVTIRRKTEFARDAGLGGVMVWELGQDAPGDASLLNVIRDVVDRTRK
jgi:chitinase